MKVVFHDDFYQIYTSDPAAAGGRLEPIVKAIKPHVTFVPAQPASEDDIAAVHTERHIESIKDSGLHEISALAAGGALQAATIGLEEPCFGLIRPPGHHASSDSCWGFCFYNNMSVALHTLYRQKKIKSAFVLDFDLHYGDGNVNILSEKGYVTLFNPEEYNRNKYLHSVEKELNSCKADIIGISAGFDNHKNDWGDVLETEDYTTMGEMVKEAAKRNNGGYFAILEGGYNHSILGENVLALIQGMER